MNSLLYIESVLSETDRMTAKPEPRQLLEKHSDWRDKMNVRIEFLAPPEDILAPIEDIWEEYI